MPKVFISYSRHDMEFANKIATSLLEYGVEAWLDTRDIVPGVKWSKAVQAGLDSCQTMLLIVSPNSMASSNVEDEWQYFLDQEKIVIPILYRPANLHFQLNRFQYIDFVGLPFETALERVLSSLGVGVQEDAVARQRAHDVVRRNYEDWLMFGAHERDLLDVNALRFVLPGISIAGVSSDLSEYILYGVVLASKQEGFNEIIPDLTNWLSGIDHASLLEILELALRHTNVSIRSGALRLIRSLRLEYASGLVITRLVDEQDTLVLSTAIDTLLYLGSTISTQQTEVLLANSDNWLVKSFALRSAMQIPAALMLTDGTDFSHQLGFTVENAGYFLVSTELDPITNIALESFDLRLEEILGVYDLVVLVRGEHMGIVGSGRLYSTLEYFLRSGGILLATPWVGWETRSQLFSMCLPFKYIKYIEDVKLSCVPTEHEIAQKIFSGQFEYTSSYEIAEARPDSIVLVETTDGVPICGYRQVGDGVCYYLNSCQHSCRQLASSPFEASSLLYDSVKRLVSWIFQKHSLQR
ncbi:toll/interleukin-1 receptor domain-containing protein [Aggregatilinea lenta]|uniref:toll/interleukin-1 receptor domain-containing protein n=1 Tax=Aggregatilinea lenta TaxID=913108 RepID=UPI000E5A7A3C|nr:toll/interleukin-1 receptor domain-containing protein [Aggregatilinea lenta]